MTVPVQIATLLEKMKDGDETAMGYAPEFDEKRYAAPDGLYRAAPTPYVVPSFMKTPVYEQRGGTCVGNSSGAALTHNVFQETQEVAIFDGEALNARVTHKFEEATSFRPVWDDLLKSGVASLADQGLYFPKGYANVDYKNVEAIKEAISTPGQMCLMAMECTDEFGSGRLAKTYLQPKEQSSYGLHAMLIVGYDDPGLIVQNNYGGQWGDYGHCRFSWDYVLRHFVEIMAVTHLPSVAGGYIKTHQYDSRPEQAIKHVDLPNRKRTATYLVKDNGLIWITDPIQAARFGVRLPAVAIPDTDQRWALPVIGPDAPKLFR